MDPLPYYTIYKTPAHYKPPDETELASNTEYPNLNSRDYAKRPLNRVQRMHPTWECITLNEEHNGVIGINKLSGREWVGSLWGFDQFDKMTPEKSCFNLQCTALLSQLEYMTKNMLIAAFQSGNLQLWSTFSEVRNSANPYCLFLVGEKCEFNAPITAMCVLKTVTAKAVVGCKNGTLKIFDSGAADLYSTHTYRFAHTDVITGVDSSPQSESVFVTCSLDKSALLWDERQTLPAIAIYENHHVRFKSVAWSDPSQAIAETVYVGDETGAVFTIDMRSPNKFLKCTEIFDRPIRKIIPNGQNLAIIGNTNIVKICDAAEHAVIYENSMSKNFIRDGAWRSSNELLTVGYEGKLRVHKINQVPDAK